MQPVPIPSNEPERLQALRDYGILDTPRDVHFDDIGHLTRELAGAAIGIISFVDANRQWFKSCIGLDAGPSETPRDISFCGHTILQREPLIIPDARRDERFADNPLVTGEPHIRFYAGFPLIAPTGYVLGSLCAIDQEPRQLSCPQIEALKRLASLAVRQLELHRQSLQPATAPGNGTGPLQPGAGGTRLASLEQLLNRAQISQMLDLRFAMGGRERETHFTLMRCGFRDYERINAALGGRRAEELMNEAARRLLIALGPGASLARFADGEFIALLPHQQDEARAEAVARRIISLCEEPFLVGQKKLTFPASIGIVVQNGSYSSPEALYSDASMALRLAQNVATSSYRFVDQETREQARLSYELEGDLREALQTRQLIPYFQPIIDLRSGEPLGFEVLARWDRNGSVLLPGSFLPIAEEIRLTGEVDLQVIEKALVTVSLLARSSPWRPMHLSVNLSAALLEDSLLRQRLLDLISDHAMPPKWVLQVEFLEEAFSDNSEAFNQFLDDLVALQARIAIDDFGTGYSSLARLISLPIDNLKIDRAFLQGVPDGNQNSCTLLTTIHSLATKLSLDTVAEGVETEAQRQWLQAQGFQRGQGHLFARAMPLNEAVNYLAQYQLKPSAIRLGEGSRRRLWRRWWR